MKKIFSLIILSSLLIVSCKKEKGCTEPNAINFDSAAEENDGTCFYEENTTGDTSIIDTIYSFDTIVSVGSFKHYIGEEFEGGVIFHLWKDEEANEHGLIVDLTDLGSSAWSNVAEDEVGESAQSRWNGLTNSQSIINQSGHSNSAASICLNSSNNGYNDWYLPAIQELNLLWINYYSVSKSLSEISDATQLNSSYYWSSSEYTYNGAWGFNFFNGISTNSTSKHPTYYIRAIRSF